MQQNLLKFFSGSVYWGDDDLRRSKLSVRVVRAEKLPAGDIAGSSDAFVEMTLDDASGRIPDTPMHKTNIVKKSLNPTWNHEETFELSPAVEPETRQVVLKVLDWDRIGDPTFLGAVRVDFAKILVEHGGRKKHKLDLFHPKRKTNGTLIIDTALESEVLKFLAHLKSKKPIDLSKNSAKSLAELLPVGPTKLTQSDIPVWLVLEYIVPRCYKDEEDDSTWKKYAFSILSQSHPIKDSAIISAKENKLKLLVEVSIEHWFSLLEKESDFHLGDEKQQKSLYDRALSLHEKGERGKALFFVIQPTLAGYPAAEKLFVECYKDLFGNEPIESLSNNSTLKNLLSGKQDSKEQQNGQRFVQEMDLARDALENVKVIEDLDVVAEHLETACLYTTDASVMLMSALFQQNDERVAHQLHQAAVKGSRDAKRVLSLLKEHNNSWKSLQKSSYSFERLLRYVRTALLSTKQWDSFSYINQL